MHATHLLNKHLSRMCQGIHKKRMTALMDMGQASKQGKKLSVTGLGRSINNTVFGVGIILVLGLLAFFMEENGFPIAPAILGIVLGPLVEENFMTSMIKADGDLLGFFERPIAAVLGVITLAIWAWILVGWTVRQVRSDPRAGGAGEPAD